MQKTIKQLKEEIVDLEYKLSLIKDKKSQDKYKQKIHNIMEQLPMDELLELVKTLEEHFNDV